MRSRVIGRWLVHCADPQGPLTRPPEQMLLPAEAPRLFEQAAKHGVLPAVLLNFPFPSGDPAFEAARFEALALKREAAAHSMMLRCFGEAVMTAARLLPVAMVKGRVFAEKLYPDPALRPFTDIDLLVAPDAAPDINRILEALGFQFAEYAYDPARLEAKWVYQENAAILIEVHMNLVHAPSLRKRMSLTFDDLREDFQTPAGMLTVAAVHAGLHQFERLRHVVDVCQAARSLNGAAEEERLKYLLAKVGGRLAAVAGLRLAHRLLGEPRCLEIARMLGSEKYSGLAALLIDRSVVVSTMSETRFIHSWRRQCFRELLKREKC